MNSRSKIASAITRVFGSLVCLVSILCASAQSQPVAFSPAYHFPNPMREGAPAQGGLATVRITSSGTLGTISVLTQGIPNQDFTVATGGTCAAQTAYYAGQTCTVAISFTPKFPGLRQGAVVLLSSSGTVIGRELITGTCLGAMASMVPASVGTVAGNGSWIYRGDGILATGAELYLPMGGAADTAGNLFISDSNNQRIRRIDGNTQIISTVVGSGTPGFAGDGGPATSAMINTPSDVKLDGAGNLYIADSGNQAVRFVDSSTGIISTIAGTPGQSGYSGDGGLATQARLSDPGALAFDGDHMLYISDSGNNVIRKVDLSTGIITTVAGNGSAGFSGDGGPATAGQFNGPWGIALGSDGSLYVADMLNNRIRKVSPTGILTTLAGNGALGFSGDNGPATQATLTSPAGVAVDVGGDVFIADSGNSMVREVNASTGIITSHAGNQSGYSDGNGAPPNVSMFDGPYALFFDGPGNLYVSDMFHQTLRVILAGNVTFVYGELREGNVSDPRPAIIENDGNAPLDFSALATVSYSKLDPSSTTCQVSQPLAIGASCVLGVESAPTATGNYLVGQISVQSDAGNSPGNITLLTDALAVDPTSITLTSSSNPSALGSNILLSATVTTSGTTQPTGTVNFLDGSTQLGSANLNSSGVATFPISSLTTGSHSLTAVYGGDDQNATSTSTVLTQLIKQPTATTLTSNHNPSVTQAAITFSASVTGPTGSSIQPSGTVTFYDGSTALGGATLNASGIATYSTATLSSGQHSIVAKYGGDADDLTSQSATLGQTVSQTPTQTSLSTSNATVGAGFSVTFTAVVSRTDGEIPTGIVKFLDGTNSLGTVNLDVTGTAVLTVNGFTAGSHPISAAYEGDANNLGSTSAVVVETVQQIPTSTVLAANSNPAAAGAVVQLSATVIVGSGATGNSSGSSNIWSAGAMSGTMTFQDGSTVLGTASVSSAGVANLAVSSLAVGSHHITASYTGCVNYAGSSSSAMVETVTSATTTTALTSNGTPSIAGKSVTLTASVTGNGGVPTGTVTFVDGAAVLGTATLNAQGVATLATVSLSVGQHSLTANYGGDAKDNSSISSVFLQTVQVATTNNALVSSSNPSAFGSAVLFTSTVSSNGASATGTVTFFDGTVILGTVSLSGGQARFSTSSLSLGSHTITSLYSGDLNDASSQSNALNETVLQASGVSLISSANPSIAGTNVTLTATVSEPQGVPVTGTVAFKEGGTLLGTSNVNAGGVATFGISSLSVGQHLIVASYSGDSSSQASSSIALVQTIQTAGTTVTLTSSANPSLTNAPLTLTSTIVGKGGAVTGTVSFQDGTTVLGTSTVNSGLASFLVPGLSPGLHSIIAVYSGDANNLQSTSPVLSQSVVQTSTVTLSSSQNPSLALDSVSLTAKVSNGSANPPSGTVSFSDGSTPLGKLTLDATGTATFTATSLATGQHSISVSYGGDTVNLPAVSPVLMQLVQLRPTTDTLTASSTSLTGGQQVTLISVVHFSGPAMPTGTVTFTSNGLKLGTSTVDPTGVAALTVNLLTSAPTVIAAYSGDANYAASTSAQTSITVAKPTQLTMQMNPSSVSLQSQQHTTAVLTLTSLNNFTDTLDLGCLGLPFAATCTFTKDQVALGANATEAVQVVIDTGSPLTAGPEARLEHQDARSVITICFMPGGIFFGLLLWTNRGKHRKSLHGLLLLLFLAAISVGLTGCGGLHINGTPAGTYVFQVTASGSGTGVTQSMDMTLTVTQ